MIKDFFIKMGEAIVTIFKIAKTLYAYAFTMFFLFYVPYLIWEYLIDYPYHYKTLFDAITMQAFLVFLYFVLLRITAAPLLYVCLANALTLLSDLQALYYYVRNRFWI